MTDPVQVAGTGKGELKKGGVFFADLPDGISSRTYKISFDRGDNLHYSVRWKNDGGDYTKDPDDEVYGVYLEGGWQCGSDPATHIRTDADCIFKEARCFIFRTFWENPGQIVTGDEFTFTANADCKTFGIPVLFKSGAVACTIDHVNCLVDRGNEIHPRIVFTGDPYDLKGDRTDMTVVENYIKKLFTKAGYAEVVFGDSADYNTASGDIHCGTNARRVVPSAKWWE